MTKDLTVGPPTRMILWFTLPLLVGNLFQQLYAVVDAIVVGRLLGVEALASVGASGSLHFLLFGFAIGTASGLAIPIARAFGAGDLAGMRRAVTTGVVISGLVTVVISLVGVFASRTLLTLMGTPPELLDDAVSFLTVFFSGTVATVAFNYLAAVVRALGPLASGGRNTGIDEPGFWPWHDSYAIALVALGETAQADAFLRPHEELAASRRHASGSARLAAVTAILHSAWER